MVAPISFSLVHNTSVMQLLLHGNNGKHTPFHELIDNFLDSLVDKIRTMVEYGSVCEKVTFQRACFYIVADLITFLRKNNED